MERDFWHEVPVTVVSDVLNTLESQIRECFGRVAYSHKTHEKCADLLHAKLGRIKIWQIALSAITTGSLVADLSNIFNIQPFGSVLAIVASAALLALNTYTKNTDLGELGQKHKDAANKLWGIRESYFSLLTDLRAADVSPEVVREKRDMLQTDLNAIYDGAPPTNSKAYTQAQKALKYNEELTFSDEEIDNFLPRDLWRGHAKAD